MQALGGVGKQAAVLVDGTALSRHVAPEGQLAPAPARSRPRLSPGQANNQELWLTQPVPDEVVENGAPRLAGLAAHVLDRQ
jgi:hypothetical protein